MKLFFVIPSLEPGGAEGQLVLLANALARRGHDVGVIALADGGALETRLKGVRLFGLGKASRADLPRVLAALLGLLRRERPNILHGYLPTANVLAALAGFFCPWLRVVFGLRVSDMDLRDLGLAGRLMYRLERLLGRRARLIIANSEAGRAQALASGFAPARLAVAHNAVDPGLRPEPEAGVVLRGQWGAGPDARLIGVVARLDPMKDQLGFVRAAALVAAARPETRFVLVGGGLPGYTGSVRASIDELGLADRIILAGKRADMPAVYAALDLLCLPSAYGEGFPNAVAEALCCGVPCVVTDTGAAALLARQAGGAGLVVRPCDPAALADALLTMLQRLDSEPGALAESAQRAVAGFTAQALAERTEALLLPLLPTAADA